MKDLIFILNGFLSFSILKTLPYFFKYFLHTKKTTLTLDTSRTSKITEYLSESDFCFVLSLRY